MARPPMVGRHRTAGTGILEHAPIRPASDPRPGRPPAAPPAAPRAARATAPTTYRTAGEHRGTSEFSPPTGTGRIAPARRQRKQPVGGYNPVVGPLGPSHEPIIAANRR